MNNNPMQSNREVIPTYQPNRVLQKIRALFIEKTLRKMPDDKRILDFCCGYGFYFLINPKAEGIDGNPLCAQYLQSRGKIIPLANVLDPLPYPGNLFSYVIAHDVFEHFYMGELATVLREIHRILVSKGILLVFVPNKKGYEYGLKINVGHKTFISKIEIEQLIPGLFTIKKHYPEPLPRFIGQWFTHNKEVFILEKI